jgi:hypothetical protein
LSLIYLLNQIHLILFDLLLPFLRFLILFLDLNLNLLPEHFCQLYTLILIICGLECLPYLPIFVPLEYLLHLLPTHPGVLLNQQCRRLPLQVPHLHIDLVELSTYHLLLLVDALADKEYLLLQGGRLVPGELACRLAGENVLGELLRLIYFLGEEGEDTAVFSVQVFEKSEGDLGNLGGAV